MTTKELRWLLAAGKPSPALKAATLLYLHGVRVSASTMLRVIEVDFGTSPTSVLINGSRPVCVTNELSNILMGMAKSKSSEESLLGYRSIPEFQADFHRMVRTAKLYNFTLSDIKEMFRAAAGSDYALLKGRRSEESRTPEEIRAAWLKVLPKLVIGE